jgi:cyclophilin family peptidyl-prolyl cis-trans isomerase/HEAT repeat protein
MKNFILSILFFISIQYIAFSQTEKEKALKEQRDKIDRILEIQDKRTIHDGKLISYFSDNDPLVRERAVTAFGSMQDTNAIPLLIDKLTRDPEQSVNVAAAFAIGQTAGLLSQSAKQSLEHDLVWARMDQVRGFARDRLIEEIGKFGTEQSLNDLILRFGNDLLAVKSTVLSMSIARFAMRNISSREAVQYLLQFIKSDNSTPWEVVYALQRIGNHEEIKNNIELIAPLWKSSNSNVRMHLATLLGKIKNSTVALEPLQKMFEFDPDWRVKVNAVRALCNYNLKNKSEILNRIQWTFDSKNMNLSMATIGAFGNSSMKNDNGDGGIKEIFSRLEKISLNSDNSFSWQLQGEAANVLAKLRGKKALPFIKVNKEMSVNLQAQFVVALGTTGSSEVSPVLESLIDDENYILTRSALEAFRELCQRNSTDSGLIERAYRAAIKSLTFNDPAVVTTAASILGDSIFLRSSSFEPLVDALSKSNIPNDIEAIQEIINTLGKLKDGRAVKILQEQFNARDITVIRAAVSALKEITGQDYSSEIPLYIEPIYVDYDTAYLHSLPETVYVTMETIRGDVKMELYKNRAPFTVTSFLKLATQRGLYRGLSFHRIVPNFVVQGGDPHGDGWGGPGYAIRSEFSLLSFETGSIGMASSGKDTEGSQFFITQSPQPHLDGRYTNFGKVISGMDIVNRLELDDHILDIRLTQ